jgi:hypothetical protein
MNRRSQTRHDRQATAKRQKLGKSTRANAEAVPAEKSQQHAIGLMPPNEPNAYSSASQSGGRSSASYSLTYSEQVEIYRSWRSKLSICRFQKSSNA